MERVEPGDQEVLSVVCPACGQPFAAEIQIDRATFEKIRMRHILERCPHCHHAARFDKDGYGFRTL